MRDGTLLLVGCNHRSAPVALRERLAFTEAQVPEVLARALADLPVAEALLLSTCNRVELLVLAQGSGPGVVDATIDFLARERRLDGEELRRHGYIFREREAVRHLFSVATGLDSMILGEPQILGQVKQAYRIAHRAGTTGPVLERLLQHCLAAAKRVRTETGISRHAVSVAFVAASLARQIFGDLSARTALVLGTGKMGELVARHLVSNALGRLLFAGRTHSRAVSAAERFGGRPLAWEDAIETLGGVDIVVSCTGATEPILDKRRVQAALRVRRGRPLLLIDIAVPRDVEPAVNGLDNVYLYDIDGLQSVVDANLDERRRSAAAAQHEIASEVDQFLRWRRSLEATPTIVAMRERLSAISADEFERHRGRLAGLSSEQRLAVESLMRGLIQKVLHQPVVHLRRTVAQGDTEACIALYRRIFGLDEPKDEEPGGAEPAPGDRGPRPGPRRLLRGGKEE